MHESSPADLIWNRACGESPLQELPGDRALSALLAAHSLAMNGGVLHAIECLTEDELDAANTGYCYYGFETVAELLRVAAVDLSNEEALDHIERLLDEKYASLIPSDEVISSRFESDLEANPSNYAPL